MSLVALANHLAEKGRGEDKMLVHMTPGEVQGLQALALAHGGSLTVNPETGLVEAGWLKKLLPAIAGFALNFIAPGVGTAIGGMLGLGGAAGTAIAVGGLTGLATGSLKQGIMAGMGAYGGASLAGGITSAGYAGAQEAALSNIPKDAIERAAESGLSEQALRNQIAAQATQDFARKGAFDQFTSGIGALGTAAGRTAAMQGVGGASGLMRAGTAAMLGADAFGQPKTTTQQPGSGFQYPPRIRPMSWDQYTGGLAQLPMFSAINKAGTTSAPVPAPAQPEEQPPGGMAGGGIVALAAGGTPDMSGLSAAQRKYAEDLMTRQGQGTPEEILGYVKGLNDYQSLASLATVQGKQGWNQPSGFDSMKLLSEMYETPIVNYGQSNAAQSPRGGIAELPAVQPTTLTPEQFKQQIYQGGADDVLATERGVNYIRQAGLTPQESLDLWNKSLGTNFGMADYERVMKQFPAAKSPVTPIAGPVVPGTVGEDKTYGGTDVLDRVTPPTLGTPGNVTQENLTMDQVRNEYEKGGGATEMPTITRLGPNERPMTQNAVVDALQAYLANNPNATSTEITSWGRANGVPEYQLRAAVNERRFSMMTGGTKNAYDYLMGRGAYPVNQVLPGGAPLMRPYLEASGISSAPGFFGRKTIPNTPTRETALTAGGGADTSGLLKWENVTTKEIRFGRPEDYRGDPEWRVVEDTTKKQASGGLSTLAGAAGGGGVQQYNLGGYSDGGRLLRGPGDGVSDSIPATIGDRQPARLADGEFVVPARIVSEIGNGSTEAGARKLYAMMDRVQRARAKTTGKGKVAKNTRADKYLPA
jgi:hypothetical protein